MPRTAAWRRSPMASEGFVLAVAPDSGISVRPRRGQSSRIPGVTIRSADESPQVLSGGPSLQRSERSDESQDRDR